VAEYRQSREEMRSVALVVETVLRRSVRLGEEIASLRAVLNRIPNEGAADLIKQTDTYEEYLTYAVDKLMHSLVSFEAAFKANDVEIS